MRLAAAMRRGRAGERGNPVVVALVAVPCCSSSEALCAFAGGRLQSSWPWQLELFSQGEATEMRRPRSLTVAPLCLEELYWQPALRPELSRISCFLRWLGTYPVARGLHCTAMSQPEISRPLRQSPRPCCAEAVESLPDAFPAPGSPTPIKDAPQDQSGVASSALGGF